MRFRKAFELGLQAAKKNLLPGLLLQSLMLVFILLYLFHSGTQEFLQQVSTMRTEMGYRFAMVCYIVSGALLPEILKIVFFQKGKPRLSNVWLFLTAAPLWLTMGTIVDFFYRCQSSWFGFGNSWNIVAIKVLVDQFIYSPFFANPIVTGYFTLRDGGFARTAFAKVFHWDFYSERVLPVQMAGWCVWIPGVSVVYCMPPTLQLPVAILIQCFWVLILTSLNERK